MTYDVLIRHTRQIPGKEGVEHRLEERQIEAASESEAFQRTRLTADDHIACIDAWHHEGIMPFSVETGEPEFFTEVHRPALSIQAGDERMG